MPERLESEVLHKVRCINTLTFYTNSSASSCIIYPKENVTRYWWSFILEALCYRTCTCSDPYH